MSDTTLLLPFALPPAEHAKDLLAALEAPALARLLARAQPGRGIDGDAFAPALPHERLLAGGAADNSPPLAHALMQSVGLPVSDGHWFVLQPVHFHVARDHLVLTDRRQLDLDDAQSRILFDAAAPLFAELGHALRFGTARYWFLRADAWHDLRTCTPDAATGHNVDVWLPQGSDARSWRRLHNEVQMLWHAHPLNEQREAHGQRRVNALWLWGGSTEQDNVPQHEAQLLAGLPPASATGHHLLFDDTLIPSALAGDWGHWLAGMQAIEARHAQPLLDALRSGAVTRVLLQLTDAQRVREWQVSHAGMRKFWRAPSLARLAG